MKKTLEIHEKKCFKYYWVSYHGVQVNDVAPFEWSCITVEMPNKISGNKTLSQTFLLQELF